MRISLNWLKTLVPVTLPPEELGEKLTMVGFEVEDIEDRRTWADGVVVGKVLTCEPHPNADKLRVCTVDIGADEPSQIVCGAPNVAAGLHVPVATVGTRLPSMGIKIKKAKLRGVPSHGMICSLTELGLETDIDGIHSFCSDVNAGDDVRPLLGLDDVILDLTSTANRADALSMVGVAREVSALTGAEVTLPEIPDVKIPQGKKEVEVSIAAPETCSAYMATIVKNVTVGPSPDWLKQRLLAAGTRPINNVVDITNYILLEWGQPLHAFDAEALPQKKGLSLGVRFAKEGEELKTLDGEMRSQTPTSLMITAADQPIALAGIMGGEESEVKNTTNTIVLEAALFDALTVRRSARPHSLRTEASARYERGVNETQLDIACNHALKLLTELAGGQVTAQAIADHRTPIQRSIELRLDRVNQILGPVKGSDGQPTLLKASEVTEILEALGFSSTVTDQIWTVAVPPHRYRDIEREIDLIEEIARLYGYDRFCETLPAKTEPGFLPPEEKFTQKLRQVMRGAGLTELLHYSWVRPNESKNEALDGITVVNPLLVEFSALRSELLTGLLNAFSYNLEQGNGPLNGFELGRVFWKEGEALREANAIAGILGGDPAQGKWIRGKDRDRPLSWFGAKGCLERIFEQMGLAIEFRADPGDHRLHPGRTASLWLNDSACGRFGQLHPQLCQERDLPEATYVFELHQDVLLQTDADAAAAFATYSTYPAVDRDLAFFITTETPVQKIEQVIWKAAKSGQLLDSVELFDEYRGDSVPEGQRSLAFRLIYRAEDRTLTEEDVTPIHEQVRKALADQLNASLRS
ncbi:Phenylalanine--tRNA ligase beta subunit [Acaryochloris thomasi RCC1774]|uniref:Phenylalanine--tRNA ligase beta subunit n=1 Tax=Acaryochloris thomasi RCC1774 TaxID=1764569 RepID=A0A2W1JL16_9CYAN|nr:phenylalanine--tRNA ligase subunit beta [Acaryochloris thomasi]PZD74080.1 Phenylalanine--tRNA ligase beta subunit [Acaryochloris thomasi RCC1774]